MSYDSYLDICLAKYQNPDRTKTEVKEVMSAFQDFRPKFEEFKTSPDETKLLLHLHGTVPAIWKGNTYNTPIAVWISDEHPNTAPTVFVTASTSIIPKWYMDINGKVYTGYIKQWNQNSSLLELISDLVEVFGQTIPLSHYISSSDDRSKSIEDLQLSNYKDPEKTKRDALRITEFFSDIRVLFGEQNFPDGTKKQKLSLSGTVPVEFQDSMDTIPLFISLMEQHPGEAPNVSVKPASNMVVNEKCAYVDQTGLVKTPYLTGWKHPNSDLVGLLQDLIVKFGKMPPLLKKTSATVNILQGTCCPGSSNSYPNNGSVPGRPPHEGNSYNTATDDARK
ncbi:tumor susceptibility gene 101 protein-like [Ruditapes philippinarum]|uniref:tumor susceptibility gene 101 protein-like n=1 Tax=Ruditapes philippinarum TaxID=129788 RepID=UPI00295BD531|nr:tumor susceptibility gene 101 protein-like [Ruditapes philippinarum]